MEHDHVVETLAPNGTNHPLHKCSLPRRTGRGQDLLHAHVSYLFSEVIAEDRVPVPQQVARNFVIGKCIPQLLARPLGGRMGGYIEVKNAATIMGQYQKHVEDLEANCGDREEIDGDELRDVVLQECAPSLRRRLPAAQHVFADARLPDVDTEFEQLAVNAWSAPPGILPAHLPDQISGLAGDDGASGLSVPSLPGPEHAKAFAMPGNDSFGSHDDQGRAPIAPEAGEADPEETITGSQLRTLPCRAAKYVDLVALGPDFRVGGQHANGQLNTRRRGVRREK